MNNLLNEACKRYDPDEDVKNSGGAYGHYLADRLLAEQNNGETSGCSKNLEKIARVALTRFPESERGESIGVLEIKGRLKKLRELGYAVPKYSHLNKQELWKLFFGDIRRAIGDEIKKVDYNFYKNIQRENKRQKDEADFCR